MDTNIVNDAIYLDGYLWILWRCQINENNLIIYVFNLCDGYGSKDEQGYVRADYAVNLYNVRTDKYKTYEIRISGVFFDRNNEQKQGIDHIVIFDENIINEGKCGIGNYKKW